MRITYPDASISSFGDIVEQQEKLHEFYTQHGTAAIQAEINKFWLEFPDDVLMFTWNQYTPYFMDGDPCEFSVWDMFALTPLTALTLGEDAQHEYYDWDEVWYQASEGIPWALALRDMHTTFVGASDLMQTCLGDHARIIVTPENMTVEEHEHE